MTDLFRRLICFMTTIALIAGGMPSDGARAASIAAPAMPACEVADAAAFRAEVERLTAAALENGLKSVDYQALVDDEWRQNGMDAIVDGEVDKAVEALKLETSWGDLLKTLTSREAAAKLATDMAGRVYRSQTMQKAIEDLAGDVGRQLSRRIELATLDAAIPAVGCVKAFLGKRYGPTISLMVAADTSRQFEGTAQAGAADVSSSDVVFQGKGALAGTVVLIVRRTVSRLAQRIGQRVVGAVLSRLVSVIAGGIGLVLIAKDIWDFRNGVLPIIEAEMKSDDNKEKVREELANAIRDQIGGHMREVSAAAADGIVDVWHQFKQAHAKVIELADRHDSFRDMLGSVSETQIPRLDRVVALVLAGEGEAGVLARVADGTLDEAVKRLPDAAIEIAADTKSLDQAFGWQRLAGPRLDSVLRYQLHRAAKPVDFSGSEFSALVALDDELAIGNLVRLKADERRALQRLAPDKLKPLARALAPSELAALGDYLTHLSADAGSRLLNTVAADPRRMRQLSGEGIRRAVLDSRDQGAAVEMVLRNGDLFDLQALQRDLEKVRSGDIQPLLIWQKHPAAVIALGLAALLLLLMLNRLLFFRRRRPA